MAWLAKSVHERDFFHEIGALSDRAIGLLAPIVLDERLTAALKARLFDCNTPNGTLLADLFRDGGELGSPGTRSKIGFAIGLYSEETRKDIYTINKIRNEFAHKLEVKDFDKPPICDLVANLKIVEKYPKPRLVGPPVSSGEYDIFEYLISLGFAEHGDISIPKHRFLRSAEILSALLHREEQDATDRRDVAPRF